MANNDTTEDFSPNLFWDIDPTTLDWNKHRAYIVGRVLEYGNLPDWRLLRSRMPLAEIVEMARNLRQLDPKTLSFISTISNTPKEEFRCYTTRQSIPPHWNF